MSTFAMSLKAVALASGLLAGLAGLASAEEYEVEDEGVSPQIAVPSPKIAVPSPKGVKIDGCWSADRKLYGPYQLSFCVTKSRGFYLVRGGGLRCKADIRVVKTSANAFSFEMRRSSCGNDTDWTADRFHCKARLTDDDFEVSGGALKPKIAVPSPEVAVPSPSRVSQLDCVYHPSVKGYKKRSFVAYLD